VVAVQPESSGRQARQAVAGRWCCIETGGRQAGRRCSGGVGGRQVGKAIAVRGRQAGGGTCHICGGKQKSQAENGSVVGVAGGGAGRWW